MAPDIELLTILRRHAVPFVIIGGHAVNFHGYRRVTEDTDVVWRIPRLASPDEEGGWPHQGPARSGESARCRWQFDMTIEFHLRALKYSARQCSTFTGRGLVSEQ